MSGQRRPDYQTDGIFRLIFGCGWLIGWTILGFGFGPPPGDPRRGPMISLCLAIGGILFVAAIIGAVYRFRQHANQQRHSATANWPDELPQKFDATLDEEGKHPWTDTNLR